MNNIYPIEIYKDRLRKEISSMLGIPDTRCDLSPDFRGSFSHEDIIVEKWVWTSEPGSKVTSLLYRPENPAGQMPAIVITNGHGGSKSSLYSLYTAQLYAKMGLACFLHDTIGEEERHIEGKMGTRAHDDHDADKAAAESGRLIMGKMVFDAIRAIDFLESRDDINKQSIGVVGNSLGGAVAQWVMALDKRVRMAIASGFGLGECIKGSKPCTEVPYKKLKNICSWTNFLALTIPQCAVMFMNGEKDYVINKSKTSEYFDIVRNYASEMERMYEFAGLPVKVKAWFDSEGGHRAYQNHKDALLWINKYLGTPDYTAEEIKKLPEITLDKWCAENNLTWESNFYDLYWVDVNHKGAVYADLGIKPIDTKKLKCLNGEELGSPEYTLKGWLDLIKK